MPFPTLKQWNKLPKLVTIGRKLNSLRTCHYNMDLKVSLKNIGADLDAGVSFLSQDPNFCQMDFWVQPMLLDYAISS